VYRGRKHGQPPRAEVECRADLESVELSATKMLRDFWRRLLTKYFPSGRTTSPFATCFSIISRAVSARDPAMASDSRLTLTAKYTLTVAPEPHRALPHPAARTAALGSGT
jgi:hypothetical protein